MYFSKSFGYALRGILYLVLTNDGKSRVRIEEIAANLSVPRHFMGKIMKALGKEGIINSAKGPHGGFFINDKTRSTKLITLLFLTDGEEEFVHCVLHFRKCNAASPCPLHHKIEGQRAKFAELLSETTIDDLVKGDKEIILDSLVAW